MDLSEKCTSCDTLFDTIAKTSRLEVIRATTTWRQECCVGFLDLSKLSVIQPLNIMALNHTIQSLQSWERFRLVAFTNDNHVKCLGIIHDRRFTEYESSRDMTDPPPTPSWQRGEPRMCLYDEETLAEVTRKVSKGNFMFSVIPGSNLGTITCQCPVSNPMFDLTAWIDELTRLGKYRIQGIWCFLNVNVPDHSFYVEVVTSCDEQRQEREIQQRVFWRRFPWHIICTITLFVLTRLLWNAQLIMPFWKKS